MKINFHLKCQIAANMLHMARVELLLYAQSGDSSTAVIDKAKDLIGNAIRFPLLHSTSLNLYICLFIHCGL